MANRLITWAMSVRIGDPIAKALLVRFADGAREDGSVWPSHATLSRDTEIPRRTLQRKIQKLVDLRTIRVEARERENGGRSSNKYWILAPPEYLRSADEDATAPCATVARGAAAKLGAAPAPQVAQPYEPLSEPLSEPEEGYSVDDKFEKILAAFAAADPMGTRRGPARTAWDRAIEDVSAERLLAAGMRYIRESPDVRRGQTTWLHVWLADRDRWENLLPRERAPQVGAAMEQFALSSSSPVPPEIRAAVVTHLGEAFGHGENFARSYLDPASWNPETKTVRLRTQTAGRRFREERITAMLLSTLGVSVVDGSEPQGSAQATSQAGEVEA